MILSSWKFAKIYQLLFSFLCYGSKNIEIKSSVQNCNHLKAEAYDGNEDKDNTLNKVDSENNCNNLSWKYRQKYRN